MSYHLQSLVPSSILVLGRVEMRSLALKDQCFSNSVSLVLTFLCALVLHRGQQKCCCWQAGHSLSAGSSTAPTGFTDPSSSAHTESVADNSICKLQIPGRMFLK